MSNNERGYETMEKANSLWESVIKRPSYIMLNGKELTGRLECAARYLEKAGCLDIVMYDFNDTDCIHISRFPGCQIDGSDNLMCGNSYVCCIKDLYRLCDSARVFIIDFFHDNDSNVKFIAKMAWKWLDCTLGRYFYVDRRKQWNEPTENFVPSYVVNTAKLFAKRNIRNQEFSSSFHAAWRLVNHNTLKKLMVSEYPNIRLLD